MITYEPFWNTMKEKQISTYFLIHTCKVSSSTLTRLRRNEPLSTVTLNDLCRFLNCDLCDILRYTASETDKTL